MTALFNENRPQETVAFNPATGEKIGCIANTPIENIPDIFAQARIAQKIWAEKSFKERCLHIHLMRNYIQTHTEELAQIITDSNGKTLIDAMVAEIIPSVLSCNWYGKHAERVLKPERREASSIIWMGKRSVIEHEPLGVVGIISPWNYPLAIPFGEIVMGLMAGNAILLKVAAATPLIGQAIEKIVAAGQLPEGLFHHIVGSGQDISTAFFNNGINKIFFTGSVQAGKQLMAQAAETLTPICLELGGKDPMIVMAEADLERAANGAAWAGYQNSGQSCGGVERVYVHRSVYEPFIKLLTSKTAALRHGKADQQFKVDIGSMTTSKQRQAVSRQVNDAVQQGAKIVAQSQRQGSEKGEYLPAILMTDVNHDMSIMREETFGPVLPVMVFDTEEQAIALANDCSMALSASVWTRNLTVGKRIARQLESGVVVINDHLFSHGMADVPWGGPKESGIGRTHGPEGLMEMTKLKVINWDYMHAKRNLWWYPQDQKTYQALKQALRLAAPHSIFEFFGTALKLLPVMLKKMYTKW